MICGHGDQLIVEEFADHQDDDCAAHDERSLPRTPEDLHRRRSKQTSETQIVLAQLMMIRKQNEELQNKSQEFKSYISKKMWYLNHSVIRSTSVPAMVKRISSSFRNEDPVGTKKCFVIEDGNESEIEGEGKPTQLSKNLRSLYKLLHKYKFKLGSRKAVKDFNTRDRGKNRYNYSMQKVFWDLVSLLMVRRGRQANGTIDIIYSYCGYKSS